MPMILPLKGEYGIKFNKMNIVDFYQNPNKRSIARLWIIRKKGIKVEKQIKFLTSSLKSRIYIHTHISNNQLKSLFSFIILFMKPGLTPQFTIEKTLNRTLDLFTDQMGPWKAIPPQIQSIFERQSLRNLQFKQIKHCFEKKVGKSNICTHFIGQNQKYYTCEDCCYDNDEFGVCICVGCWDPQKHVGHDYEKEVNYEEECYCDCGWDNRIRPSSFCDRHGSKEIIQMEIQEKEREKFKEFWKPLLLIGLYLTVNTHQNRIEIKYWIKLSQALIELLENSIYYVRIFMDTLSERIRFKGRNCSILEALLRNSFNHQKLIFTLASDKKTKIELAKVINELISAGQWIQKAKYKDLIDDCFSETEILVQLAKSGVFIDKYNRLYLEYAFKNSQTGQKILYNYLFHQKQMKSPESFVKFVIRFWHQHEKSIDISDNVLAKLLFDTLFNLFDQIERQYQQQFQHQRNALIAQYIMGLCRGRIQEIIDFQSKLEAFEINKQKYQDYLYSSMKTVKTINCDLKTQSNRNVITILLLLLKNPQKKLLVDRLWDNITQSLPIQIIDAIYSSITLINDSEQYQGINVENQTEDYEEKQQWFRSYLYENQKIRISELQELRKKTKKLNFKGSGLILKQLCRCNGNSQTFEYSSDKQYPNLRMRLKVRSKEERRNFIDLQKGKINFNDRIQWKQNSPQKLLFNLIFDHPSFLKYYRGKWWEKVKECDRTELRKSNLGYCYIKILLYVKNLSEKAAPQIQKQLETISNDQSELLLLNELNSQQDKIIELLPEAKIPSHSQKPKQNQSNANRLNNKKILKSEKLNNRRKQILKNYGVQHDTIEEEDNQQYCIICRSKDQQHNPLQYLGYLGLNNLRTSVFYGNNDKSGIMLSTCFHAIHASCYEDLNKLNMEFSCPLCSESCNILLPFNIKSEESLNYCKELMEQVYSSKIKSETLFCLQEILFKHLIESYGLNSLLNMAKYQGQKRQRRKIDRYITKLIEHVSKSESSNLSKVRQDFEQSLKDCNRKNIAFMQYSLSRILYHKLTATLQQQHYSILSQLTHQLIQQDFQVLKQSIEHLLQQNIEVKQKQSSIVQLQSISITLIDLPETLQQLRNQTKFKKSACGCFQPLLLCLISGKYFCASQKCQGFKKHIESYNGAYIMMKVDSGRIIMQQSDQKKKKIVDIYFDAFMFPFFSNEKSGQIFYLNKAYFDQAAIEFFRGDE